MLFFTLYIYFYLFINTTYYLIFPFQHLPFQSYQKHYHRISCQRIISIFSIILLISNNKFSINLYFNLIKKFNKKKKK